VNVKLRKVEPKDWEFILNMRNQDDIRFACHDSSIIDYETHKEYMKRLDLDPNSHQWIVVYEEQDVGHTKIIGEEFGYMIKDGFRGKGIGTKIYELVFEEAKKLGIKRLHDTIKIDKPIPLKVAKKVGFIEKGIIKKDGKPYAFSLDKIIE